MLKSASKRRLWHRTESDERIAERSLRRRSERVQSTGSLEACLRRLSASMSLSSAGEDDDGPCEARESIIASNDNTSGEAMLNDNLQHEGRKSDHAAEEVVSGDAKTAAPSSPRQRRRLSVDTGRGANDSMKNSNDNNDQNDNDDPTHVKKQGNVTNASNETADPKDVQNNATEKELGEKNVDNSRNSLSPKVGVTAITQTSERTLDATRDPSTGGSSDNATDGDETPSPLLQAILGSSSNMSPSSAADLKAWYMQTFENELSEVKKASRRASRASKKANSAVSSFNSKHARGTSHEHHSNDAGSNSGGDESSTGGESNGHTVGSGGGGYFGLELRENMHSPGPLEFVDDSTDDLDSSISDRMATRMELALMQAQEQAENQAKEKDLLERRLVCLEEIEELRMKLATFELQDLMEKQTSALPTEAPRWVTDSPCCQRCDLPFNFYRRRHHCRRCGRCLCANCAPSDNQAPIPHFGYHNPVRQCLDCLPPAGSKNAKSPAKQGLAFSSVNKTPYSSAIDGIRRMENSCLREPSSENLILTLQSYVHAVEKISKSTTLDDRAFRKWAHRVLLNSMRAFLQMPQIQETLREQGSETTQSLLMSVMNPSSSAPSSPTPTAVLDFHEHSD